MARDTQRRFQERDEEKAERRNGGFHLFQHREKQEREPDVEDSGIKATGLESMAEPVPEEDFETSRSTVHEAGGLERMMDDRGDEDISEEDLRLDDRFLDEEFLEDDGERNVVRRRVKKPKRTGVRAAKVKKKKREMPGWMRRTAVTLVTVMLLVVLGMMILSRVIANDENTGDSIKAAAAAPEGIIARIVTPVQSLFSSFTESIAGYFRTLKLRANIETEYNNLRAENERLVYEAMLAEELQQKLSTYENMFDEISANESMNPITATVIGRADGNYFSTFTINRGTRDGVEDYMAVTISGALIGYTENTNETSAQVRAIIDGEASIAGLIQSSRDQGTVRGTLSIDGTPMCRMYYLPEDHLPRPGDTVVTSGVGMSFPKGIPIGTVRESTRGMEANKQYIVVEPMADFEHIEYVIVLRYKPTAEAVQGRESATDIEFVPLETQRPVPTLRIGGNSSFFGTTATPNPDETPTPTPSSTPSPTPSPTPTSVPLVTPEDTGPVYEYVVVDTSDASATETPAPTDTPTPSPTPYITLSPDDLTWEED